MSTCFVKAPVDGRCILLKSVHDAIFSRGMAGLGCAIIPSHHHFVSPIEGKIKLIFPGLHVYVIEDCNHNNILVHIGVNTLSLNGQGFTTHVKQHQHVSCGQVLVSVEESLFTNPKYDFTTLVLMMKPQQLKQLEIKEDGPCQAAQTTIISYVLP